jgi:two-component sensor histidine kinase
MKADAHPQQEDRLRALRRYKILDTEREKAFDDLVELAASICDAPISVINLIDEHRQWFKAEVGLGARETPIDTSICSHVILDDDFVEIRDTLEDTRMSDNPLCLADTAPLRFYAGALLRTNEGLPIGTLCVLDHRPRSLTDLQRRTIRVLAAQVMRHFELRLALEQQSLLHNEVDHRVKNSLAMVSGLIRLQARKVKDPIAKTALASTQTRVNAIAALHQAMHQTSSVDEVDMSVFARTIQESLAATAPPNVDVRFNFNQVTVPSEVASSVAMIVNEFTANSFQHAFPDGRHGKVEVTGFVDTEGRLIVEASDNGVGNSNPAAVSESDEFSSGLGIRIIESSTASLGGKAESAITSDGARMTLTVPIDRMSRG